MKHIIYIFAIIGLSGALAWKFTREPEQIESVRIERDTIVPPPVVKWLKPDKIIAGSTSSIIGCIASVTSAEAA